MAVAFKVQGSGLAFRVQFLGFGLACRVQGLGRLVGLYDSAFKALGWPFGFRI